MIKFIAYSINDELFVTIPEEENDTIKELVLLYRTEESADLTESEWLSETFERTEETGSCFGAALSASWHAL